MDRYPAATWSPSPNFNRGRDGAAIDLIVVHITDGGPRLDHCIESFQKPENQKSAHFVVGRDGEIVQLVSLDDRAWHDANRNKHTVGVEHIARSVGEFDRKWPTLSEHTRRALLPDGVGWDAPTDPGLPLTEPQLQASARLVAWLCQELGLGVDAVVPHCSNPTTTHRDCGRDVEDGGIWPWRRYRELVAAALAA